MFKKILGFLVDSNEKALENMDLVVGKVNELEEPWELLSVQQLRAKTEEFKARLASGEELDGLLPEAFASVREAAKRTLKQRHFDVQIMGGMALHSGKVAEMKTGEGKTMVATLSVYLNALASLGVHVVTVNDYLAKRDAEWMGPIYSLLGLSVGCIQQDGSFLLDVNEADTYSDIKLVSAIRKDAYLADITYGTNNEFGFDYLRDNMAIEESDQVQRGLHYAIVDEVDNILIDEARTPLIISGPAQESTNLYSNFSRLVPRLQVGDDYTVDEKHKSVNLTDIGIGKMEKWLNVDNLYATDNFVLTHYIENALKAEVLFQRDREYVVNDGEVVIVDEFTGRLMSGRRYSDGLHQAIEAKEKVRIQRESVTYATITLQNYFRMYDKLSGMTGTASTEAEELDKIYGLDVLAIPTNVPMIRKDLPDLVYATEKAKFQAIAKNIKEIHDSGSPVLVGTVSIEKSEMLASMLKHLKVQCEVLNAKQHEKEAEIVAQAGRIGSVTVATNMAGRGTDIILGGNPNSLDLPLKQWEEDHDRVVQLGGLHIVGTERHESRRIDNQLRGRSGRQGDPGTSRFYVSLEDDVMRRFGGERVKGFMEWVGLGDETPIESGVVNKSIEASQGKVEGFHFEMRKHLVEYDDVMNTHRDVIYKERRKILSGADLATNIKEMVHEDLISVIEAHCQGDSDEDWDSLALESDLRSILPLPDDSVLNTLKDLNKVQVLEAVIDYADSLYVQKENEIGSEDLRGLERIVMLRTMDINWLHHLTTMENLRQGIGLHAFGQRDPLVMYKREGHEMFQGLLARIQNDIVRAIYHVGQDRSKGTSRPQKVTAPKIQSGLTGSRSDIVRTSPTNFSKVGRNDPCPCGSGQKYKRCHGVAA